MYNWPCKKEFGSDTPKWVFHKGGWNPPPPWITQRSPTPHLIGLTLQACMEQKVLFTFMRDECECWRKQGMVGSTIPYPLKLDHWAKLDHFWVLSLWLSSVRRFLRVESFWLSSAWLSFVAAWANQKKLVEIMINILHIITVWCLNDVTAYWMDWFCLFGLSEVRATSGAT